jgi:cbb3-type cytochrome oxidase subunit 3
MRLSDIMSNADLTTWPQIALVIFVAVFLGIVGYVFLFRKKDSWERQRHLPLEDGPKSRSGADPKRGS